MNDRFQTKLITKKQRLDFVKRSTRKETRVKHFIPGVSVIVPCYRSVETISATLKSLYSQSLDFGEYEVIVVFNGDDDGSVQEVESFATEFPELNLRTYFSSRSGAGTARNVALNLVRHANVTFVDADDFVETDYLKVAVDAMPVEMSIVASPIHNLEASGVTDESTVLNERIRSHRGTSVSLTEVPWILGFNACKLVPAELLIELRYREDLDSGEDLVFFANLLSTSGLRVVFPEETRNAAYVRRLTSGSVSRREASFDFNVRQRVECIAALREIDVPEKAAAARVSLERAQASFVKRFLEDYPEETEHLGSLLIQMKFLDFPWNWINDGKATGLAFSYCFVPYADTSAVVAAKALSERAQIVDVISADMSKNRGRDVSLAFLCSKWIDKHFEVAGTPSFSDWKLIIDFAKKAVGIARTRQKLRGAFYETIYSRALWIGSHVAGALFKIEYPEVVWSAEFSDPLRFDVEGNSRVGSLPDDSESKMFREIVRDYGSNQIEITTIFDLVEAATLVLADELIFTNQNQMDFMLAKYPSEFVSMVIGKSRVREHPAPEHAAYQVVDVDPGFSSNRINVAYFGAFYVNRGLGDVFTAIRNLTAQEQKKLAFHVFCKDVDDALQQILEFGLQGIVSVHPYLPYLHFLNASTKADVLLVNDVVRPAKMDINPFLPSKYSDYQASRSKIWGILDKDSALSRKQLDYKSEVGNVPSIVRALRKIVEDYKQAD